jgi:hypothetical protein
MSACLTRVLLDDRHSVDVAQLQRVMQRIESALPDIPVAQRAYISRALLIVALARHTAQEEASQVEVHPR